MILTIYRSKVLNLDSGSSVIVITNLCVNSRNFFSKAPVKWVERTLFHTFINQSKVLSRSAPLCFRSFRWDPGGAEEPCKCTHCRVCRSQPMPIPILVRSSCCKKPKGLMVWSLVLRSVRLIPLI